MKHIESDIQARILLPGGTSRLYVVLFQHSRDPDFARCRRDFAELAWPDGVTPCTVRTDAAPRVATWFGVRRTPLLVAVAGGLTLEMSDLGDLGCPDALVTAARAQWARIESDG